MSIEFDYSNDAKINSYIGLNTSDILSIVKSFDVNNILFSNIQDFSDNLKRLLLLE